MKTIRVALEYGLYPIWLLYEQGIIVENILAEELGFDAEFSNKVQKLQDLYDSLYINTDVDFYYIGQMEPKKVEKIKHLYTDISSEFKVKLRNKYKIEISKLYL